MAQILRTENLKVINKIAGTDILLFDNLTVTVEEREWINIFLSHGAGKTTLYNILLSQNKPTNGKVIFNNKEKMDEYDVEKFLRENVTAIPEHPVILENFTVRDWTRFQIELIRPPKYKKRLQEYYNTLKDQNINLEKHLTQLSLFDIRKLEILFSILADTILIICDDLDVGLTPKEQDEMGEYLRIISKNKSVLTISSSTAWNKYAKKVIRP